MVLGPTTALLARGLGASNTTPRPIGLDVFDLPLERTSTTHRGRDRIRSSGVAHPTLQAVPIETLRRAGLAGLKSGNRVLTAQTETGHRRVADDNEIFAGRDPTSIEPLAGALRGQDQTLAKAAFAAPSNLAFASCDHRRAVAPIRRIDIETFENIPFSQFPSDYQM